jgi:hypothetical protein
MGLRPTYRDEKLFPAVILSDERSEESKDLYSLIGQKVSGFNS